MKMEKWDLYNAKREKSGITMCRGEIIPKGLYHLSVSAWIVNQQGQYLLSQRHPKKQYPLYWECTGGSVFSGETSLQGAIREVKEELGISFTKEDAIFFREVKRDKKIPDFKDLWIFQKNIPINEITFPDGEATESKWVTIEQFIEMVNKKEIVPTIDFGEEEYKLAVEVLKKKKLERYYDNTEADTPKKK